MPASHKIKLNGEGNQQAKHPATNLNISFKQVASEAGSNASNFERKNGNGLVYRHKLSLNDALQCQPVKMTTMDGRKLLIAIDQIPSPGSVKVIHGEGMVISDDTDVGTQSTRDIRGDLYVCFDVEFPKRLPNPERRRELIAALCGEV